MNPAWTDTTALWEAFERTVEADSEAAAVSSPDAMVTREQLAAQASALAIALGREGVREDSVVALMLPNSVDFVAAFLAVAQLPAIAALVSPRYRASEIQAISSDIRPDFILVPSSRAASIVGLLTVEHHFQIPGVGLDLSLLRLREPRQAPAANVRERFGLQDQGSFPALFKFTSGSTGAPKAVLWTAANVRGAAANVVETLELDASDVVLAQVPLSHSYGFDLGLLPLIFAGTQLVLRSGFSPQALVRDLVDERISVFLGVPAMYSVLNRKRLDPVPDLSSIRYLLSCTAPLSVTQIETFRRRFNAPITQHYGSSETGGVTLHVASEIERRPGSVGRAMKNVGLSIVDAQGELLPAGVLGQVVINGEATAAGYVSRDTLDGASRFRGGRYWTGDMGFLDADGFLYLDGSRAGVINVGGWKVSLAEVAQVLESHPTVSEASVTALPSPAGKQRIVAAVTLHDPADEVELIGFCQALLADYKVPRRVHILKELPRTLSPDLL